MKRNLNFSMKLNECEMLKLTSLKEKLGIAKTDILRLLINNAYDYYFNETDK